MELQPLFARFFVFYSFWQENSLFMRWKLSKYESFLIFPAFLKILQGFLQGLLQNERALARGAFGVVE